MDRNTDRPREQEMNFSGRMYHVDLDTPLQQAVDEVTNRFIETTKKAPVAILVHPDRYEPLPLVMSCSRVPSPTLMYVCEEFNESDRSISE